MTEEQEKEYTWTKVQGSGSGEGNSGETWKPEEGDKLIGEYVGKQENVGMNNSTLYSFKDEEGNIMKVWGSAVINSRMEEIEEGSIVKIEYKGKHKSEKTGRTMKMYDIYIGEL